LPLPPKKMSRSKRDKRRTHQKIAIPALAECPQCHSMKQPHNVCLKCGYYNGREIISSETKKKK
jgi:large subunit ribosomal protein L32